MNFEELWVEKYRPKTLQDILLSQENREFFENLAKQDKKSIPHLMFFGNAGTGKTTLAKIIVNDILKCEYLYINASEQNSIDTVRGVITNFVQTKSFDGDIKVVILDEFDGFSNTGGSGSSAQQALRNLMEEYSLYARFILTCNYADKVIEPIWSRVQAFDIRPDYNAFMKRCLEILKKEKIIIEPESKQVFVSLIDSTYPDLRRCINELQKCSINGSFKPSKNCLDSEISVISKECFRMLLEKLDIVLIRKYVIENERKFNSEYNVLMKSMFENIYNSELDMDKKKTIMLIIAESMFYDTQVLDKEINYFAMCIKIGNVI